MTQRAICVTFRAIVVIFRAICHLSLFKQTIEPQRTPKKRTKPSVNSAAIINYVVYYYAEKLRAVDLDVTELLQTAGFHNGRINQTSTVVPVKQFYQFIELALKEYGQPGLGFAIGDNSKLSDLGVLGLSSLSASRLADAFERLRRFHQVNRSFWHLHLDLTETGEVAVIPDFDIIPSPEVEAFFLQELIARLLRFASMLTNQQALYKQINLTHHCVSESERQLYEVSSHCPVNFDSARNALVIPAEVLDAQIKLPSDVSQTLNHERARYILDRFNEPSALVTKVRETIIRYQIDGLPSREQVAEKLFMSARTMRRQLQSAGTSYQEIVEQIRQEQAVDLLDTTTLSLGQISDTLGYSDQRSFLRAFKRWTGQSPSAYRLQLRG